MHINLPATITQAKTEHQARSPHRHDQPARDLKPTGRTNLSAFQEQGASIAALARTHGVSRVAIRTALAGLLPDQAIPPPRSG
ncbi:hypothetical protein GCM10010404_18970 [Nonomuraea africana]|uniref:Resolvase HTH domain-containing protein n=1 Tax=Nonomuraea africana TaxID=46171 RepID=A0ABR9KLB2_9ACTN|nr:hypothetical protein [Nonomuraea africana]MBE1562765.1 hypothetical protein [Nonomuraea africana]